MDLDDMRLMMPRSFQHNNCNNSLFQRALHKDKELEVIKDCEEDINRYGNYDAYRLLRRSSKQNEEIEFMLSIFEEGINESNNRKVLSGLSYFQNIRTAKHSSILLQKLSKILLLGSVNILLKVEIIKMFPFFIFLGLNSAELHHEKLIKRLSKVTASDKEFGAEELKHYISLSIGSIQEFPRFQSSSKHEKKRLALLIFKLDLSYVDFTDAFKMLVRRIEEQSSCDELKIYLRIQLYIIQVLATKETDYSLRKLNKMFTMRNSKFYHSLELNRVFALKTLMLESISQEVCNRVKKYIFKYIEKVSSALMVCCELSVKLERKFGIAFEEFVQNKLNKPSKFSDRLKSKIIYNRNKIIEDYSRFTVNNHSLKHIKHISFFKICNKQLEHVNSIHRTPYIQIKLSKDERQLKKYTPEEALKVFLNEENSRLFILLGKIGSGKTTVCIKMMDYMLKANEDFYPIYINFDEEKYHKRFSIEEFILNYGADYDSVKMERILFICDGFCKMKQGITLIEFNKIFDRFPLCKVLFAFRADKLERIKSLKFFNIDAFKNKSKKIMKFSICPLTLENVCKITRTNILNIESLKEIQLSCPKLLKILQSPLLAKLSIESNVQVTSELTRFTIFSNYLKKKFNYKTNQRTAEDDSSLNLLSKLEDDLYYDRFHQSHFTDFLIASNIKTLLKSNEKLMKERIKTSELNRISLSNLTLSFIKDYMNASLKNNILKIIKQCKGNNKLSLVIKNCIKILKKVKFNFSSMRLNDLDLKTINFTGLNLTKSEFKRSDLRFSKIKYSALMNSNFANSNLLKLKLFDWPEPLLESNIIYNMTLSSNFLAYHDSKYDFIILDIKNSQEISKIKCRKTIIAMKFSKNTKYLGYNTSSEIHLFDLKLKQSMIFYSNITFFAFTPNEKYFYTIKNCIWAYNIIAGTRSVFSHIQSPESLAISEEQIAAAVNSNIRVIQMKSGKTKTTLKYHCNTRNMIFMDCMLAVAYEDRNIIIWNTDSEEKLKILKGHTKPITCLDCSRDKKLLVSGSDDCYIKVWDILTGKTVALFNNDSITIKDVYFHNASIFSYSSDNSIQKWKLKFDGYLKEDYKNIATAIPITSNTILCCSQDNFIKTWDLKSGEERSSIAAHSLPITSLACSKDWKYVMTGSKDKTLKLWNLRTMRHIYTFKGHTKVITCVGWSDDLSMVASGSSDKHIKIWDTKNKTLKIDFIGHDKEVNCLAFARNYLISGSSDATLKVWSLINKEELVASLEYHTLEILSIAISADRRFCASASRDRTIKLWDLEFRRCKYNLEGHKSSVLSVAISMRFIVSASSDASIRVWSLGSGKFLRELRTDLNPVLFVSTSLSGQFISSVSDNSSVKVWRFRKKNQCLLQSGKLFLRKFYNCF